jgi:hypothetical protein
MPNWHSSDWHSTNCLKKSSFIGAVDRTFTWIKASAEEGCEGCRIAQCAVEKYCERWFAPEHRKVLVTPQTDIWSEHDVRIDINGDARNLHVEFRGGWYNPRLNGVLEIFTEPGTFLSISWKLIPSTPLFCIYRSCISEENPSPWPSVGTGRIRWKSSASKGCLSVIKGWIDSCVNGHPGCVLSDPQYLPYRLIDVGSDGDTLKLCESPDLPGGYIALSHCWGEQMPLITTNANLAERKTGITTPSLPQTFLDAIQMTRNLGIRYLWIDTLCIVQDDKKDWEQESAKMHLVYSNAYLVIAATRSPNSTHGLFHARPPKQKLAKAFYTGQNANGDSYCLHARLFDSNVPCHSNFHTAVDDMSEFPLLSRTWVMQERILATRVLHFCEEELVWECHEGVRCECMYLDFHQTGTRFGTDQWSHKFFKPRWSECILDITPSTIYDTWHMVVETASRLSISYESDKLPALSGIAKKMQQKGAGVYLAGLWSANLAADLLWTASAGRPKVWRAPSWSWASTEGAEVNFPSKKNPFSKDYSIEISGFECPAAGADPTGEVSTGSITVIGLVTECRLGRSVHEHLQKWHERIACKDKLVCRVICDSGEDVDNGPMGMQIYTLLMRRDVRDPNSNDPTPFHALVLRKSQGLGGKEKVEDAFERIGIVQFERFWRSTVSQARWEDWFEGAERKVVTIV